MRRLGTVVSVSEGKLVLKTEKLVKIGSRTYNEKEIYVGTVIDFFGPTDGPYVLVSPESREPGEFIGEELYG